ncbi:MAG: 3-keto-5-aminohexanoate cleavage protein [Bacteroidota bacterium]
MDKVIITAAVCGSSPTKEMNPAVPYTPKEIADAAIACWREGAAIAHIHVRDPETGQPDSSIHRFQEVLERIRAETDMIVNLTTSGLNLTGTEAEIIEQRLEPVSLGPDICSLDVGSMNFGARIFKNSPQFGELAAKRMQEHKVKPEVEIFDAGHLYQAIDMIEKGWIDGPPWLQLCMGIRWGIKATPENLLFLVNRLPSEAIWSVLGVGKAQLPMIAQSIILGGHVRVGFEDNIYLRKGVLAKSNAAFVENAVQLVRQLQREVASPAEARTILQLP